MRCLLPSFLPKKAVSPHKPKVCRCNDEGRGRLGVATASLPQPARTRERTHLLQSLCSAAACSIWIGSRLALPEPPQLTALSAPCSGVAMASVGMQQSVVPTGLPVLPGNGFKDPTKVDFKKSHIFDVSNGITVNKDPASAAPKGPISAVAPPQMYSKGEVTVVPVQPAWVAFDRKVLRFDCYFKESVHESRLENYRIRKCVLYYYLEDDSMHVSEPKVENSGIPQARLAAVTARGAWACALPAWAKPLPVFGVSTRAPSS